MPASPAAFLQRPGKGVMVLAAQIQPAAAQNGQKNGITSKLKVQHLCFQFPRSIVRKAP
jgi:hypothetical protein